jgi:hypothetical protein
MSRVLSGRHAHVKATTRSSSAVSRSYLSARTENPKRR